MGFFDFFRSRSNPPRSSEAANTVEQIASALLVNAIALAKPLLDDKVRRWDIKDPYLLLTLGYISGFIDASYQFTAPRKYDENYVNRLFLNAIETNLGEIDGSSEYLDISRIVASAGGSFISGLQKEAAFMRGTMAGGNDFVSFARSKRPPLSLASLLSE